MAFLPVTLICTAVTLRVAGRRAGLICLGAGSLFFYGYWEVASLAIIGFSIAWNFGLSHLVARSRKPIYRLAFMWLGIAGNLAALGYYKYVNFFLANVAPLFGATPAAIAMTLPLAISFYTFQQIAFMVDIYGRKMDRVPFAEYAGSVVFFPHLIAGPLLHYQDIVSQFKRRLSVSQATLSAGLPIFAVGLVKKVAIADGLSVYVGSIFARGATTLPDFFSAWGAALGYTAQLYFDFSGYSDMAIGIALMFGITLPVNFRSPYKATSIIDFWRRWHITLSSFLRDYLYIPLGGGRVGPVRRLINLLIVMLLGGLWHGAAWTFVFWGGLHGSLLILNHFWRERISPRLGRLDAALGPIYAGATFLAVVIAWVFFRAPNFATAQHVILGMCGLSTLSLPGEVAYLLGVDELPGVTWGQTLPFKDFATLWLLLAFAFALIWGAPNTADLFNLDDKAQFRSDWTAGRSFATAITTGILLWISAFNVFGSAPSEFLYFQF
ncbi:MBOAT family O-acyltransferase [Bradyrhizobium cytisi]|uniref:MBOAT family O-acyltransferase n=1 Tax=Bradyrhizobium cytisi TaxID=515489 RepID=UPI0011E828E7|nr:MBOAT family O-acyltransferase [Bradyrhizobium cytisi]